MINHLKKSIILVMFVVSNLCAKANFNSRDTYPKNPNVDMINYAFALTLSDNSNVIKGSATLTFAVKRDSVSNLRLDLVNAAVENNGKGMTVLSIKANGKNLAYTHRSNVLSIKLLDMIAGVENTITIEYQGVPADGFFIGPNKYGDRCFFSDNWPNKARNWLPTVDHPYDKATSEFIIIAPVKYQVVSNGLKVEESNIGNGLRLTHWKQSVPIACWLYVLGVAEFAIQEVGQFDGKSIQTWVYRQDRIAGFYDFATPTKQVLQYFSDYVGPYAYEKLANIQSTSAGGGMEAASAILYNEKSIVGDRNKNWRNVVIHEIAHQWFGNAVTEYDWNDVWLSEGFATYFTARFIKHAYGQDEFVNQLKTYRKNIIKTMEKDQDYLIVHKNLSDMSKVTSNLTYEKGAWFLNMLCNYVGEEIFQTGIRNYYRQFYNGNVTTNDFRLAMEKASGKDLKMFFHQWLYQGGTLKLKGDWSYDANTKMITIKMEQLQSEKYQFQMPIDLTIISGAEKNTSIKTIQLDKRSISIAIPSANKPLEINIDPETRLLAEWEFLPSKN